MFSVNKRVMGSALFAKTPVGQFNEVYCRFIAHNLVRLIHVWYQLEAVTDVADFGVSEPIYFNSGAVVDLPQQNKECDCRICQHMADPFYELPGQPRVHSPNGGLQETEWGEPQQVQTMTT